MNEYMRYMCFYAHNGRFVTIFFNVCRLRFICLYDVTILFENIFLFGLLHLNSTMRPGISVEWCLAHIALEDLMKLPVCWVMSQSGTLSRSQADNLECGIMTGDLCKRVKVW